jgi:Domain of unknown function (DUF3601).
MSASSFTAFDLLVGTAYEVILPFEDFDGVTHPIGERWKFLSKSFLPYDAGLTLFIEVEEGKQSSIRLQDYPEAQGPVIDHFAVHVKSV